MLLFMPPLPATTAAKICWRSPAARARLAGCRSCGGRVIVFEPGYAEHAASWQAAGHTISTYPISQRDAVLLQLAAGDLPAPDVVIVINPHNPTGDVVGRDLLLQVHARLVSNSGWLLIDEAFADGGAATSCIQAQMPSGLIVLRSLGKFFGLPGLRSGFAFAAPALLENLRDHAGPWPLTTAAQFLLPQALNDTPWQAAAANTLQIASSQLRQQLLKLGRPLLTGTSLFQGVQFDSPAKAAAVQRRLAQQGILVRHYADSKLLRLGLPARIQQWQQLATAISEIPSDLCAPP